MKISRTYSILAFLLAGLAFVLVLLWDWFLTSQAWGSFSSTKNEFMLQPPSSAAGTPPRASHYICRFDDNFLFA